MSFDNNCYGTPLDFFNRLDDEFQFDIDAAAQSHTAKCREFYTREQNVLEKDFHNGDAEFPLSLCMPGQRNRLKMAVRWSF